MGFKQVRREKAFTLHYPAGSVRDCFCRDSRAWDSWPYPLDLPSNLQGGIRRDIHDPRRVIYRDPVEPDGALLHHAACIAN